MKTTHTPGTFCPCDRCAAETALSLADSHYTCALQRAQWHPRSKRAAKALEIATAERERARAVAVAAGVVTL